MCAGEMKPELPVILANWHHDYYWEANVTHVDELTTAMKAAPVSHLFMQGIFLLMPCKSCCTVSIQSVFSSEYCTLVEDA